jgi:catechol 2,3-dioxygenase-like lactoylglutathione lyase family enzyme
LQTWRAAEPDANHQQPDPWASGPTGNRAERPGDGRQASFGSASDRIDIEPITELEPTLVSDFPSSDMELTHILVVRDVVASRDWYEGVLGARLQREYGGTSAVFSFNGVWLLLVTGGGPSPDKPGVTFEAPIDRAAVSHSFTIRVPDCQRAYEVLSSRGAEFLTPPYDWGSEIRCFFPDPDGHLFEISQVR